MPLVSGSISGDPFAPQTSATAEEAADNLRKIIEQGFKFGQLQIALDATNALYNVGYGLSNRTPGKHVLGDYTTE